MNNLQKIDSNSNIIENPWALLREYTDARIGLPMVRLNHF